jgi:hypothetical protein
MTQPLSRKVKDVLIAELLNRHRRVEFWEGEIQKAKNHLEDALVARQEYQKVCGQLGITLGDIDEAQRSSSSHT